MGVFDKSVRVAIAGASGTGKTTIAAALQARFDLPLNPVGARSTAKALGFDKVYDIDDASMDVYSQFVEAGFTPQEAASKSMGVRGNPTVRRLFQRKLQAEKIAWENAHAHFVTDRSIVDDLVYTVMHDSLGLTNEYLKRSEKHLKTIDVLLVTPIQAFQNLGDDPMRVKEPAYHETYERILGAFLADWRGVDSIHFAVSSGADERCRWAIDAVLDHIDPLRNSDLR